MAYHHIKGLDGLRGMAALAVFVSHYDQIIFIDQQVGPFDVGQLAENGKFAVSIFFTLSGFLLSLPYWEHLLYGGQSPNIKRYISHRLARILPAYYCCLTILLILSGEWRLAFIYPDAILHYTFLFNYTEFTIFSINSAFWTIAVEVQFYLLLPFLFICLGKFVSKAWLIMILIIVTSYSVHSLLLSAFDLNIEWPFDRRINWINADGAVLSQSLLAHLPHFCLGILAAWLVKVQNRVIKPNDVNHDALFLISLVTVIIILSTPAYDYILIPYGRYGFPLATVLAAIIIVSIPQSSMALKLFDNLMARKLGELSYGIYLYHLPILNCTEQTMKAIAYQPTEHWIVFAGSGLTLTLLTAFLSYRLIERPVSNIVRRKDAIQAG